MFAFPFSTLRFLSLAHYLYNFSFTLLLVFTVSYASTQLLLYSFPTFSLFYLSCSIFTLFLLLISDSLSIWLLHRLRIPSSISTRLITFVHIWSCSISTDIIVVSTKEKSPRPFHLLDTTHELWMGKISINENYHDSFSYFYYYHRHHHYCYIVIIIILFVFMNFLIFHNSCTLKNMLWTKLVWVVIRRYKVLSLFLANNCLLNYFENTYDLHSYQALFDSSGQGRRNRGVQGVRSIQEASYRGGK